jgi:hypothetical protein
MSFFLLMKEIVGGVISVLITSCVNGLEIQIQKRRCCDHHNTIIIYILTRITFCL